MEKTKEKGSLKIAAAVLAILIVLTVAGGMILFLFFGSQGISSKTPKPGEMVKLTAAQPESGNKVLENRIIVSSNAAPTETAEEKKEEKTEETNGDYVIAASNQRLLTDADLDGLSLREVNYAKNEIYARHGRKFASKELQDYFGSKSWYQPKYEGKEFDANYSGRLLSETEKKNAEFLKAAENRMSSGGYKLDQ